MTQEFVKLRETTTVYHYLGLVVFASYNITKGSKRRRLKEESGERGREKVDNGKKREERDRGNKGTGW